MNQHRTVEKAMNAIEDQVDVSLTTKQGHIVAKHLALVYVAGFESKKEPRSNPNKKGVRQLDRKGVEVNSFESITQAAKYNGISHKGIVECLKGRAPTYKGYIWVYTD